MSRHTSILLAGAAFTLAASLGAAAYAQGAAPKTSQTIVRTDRNGETHEVKVVRDASGKVTVTRDGKITTSVDPQEIRQRVAMATGMPRRDMAEHLRNALQLKPSQEPALTAYLEAARPQREMVVRMEDRAAPKTTPQRLAEMETSLAEHDARMKAHIEATRRFYDQLDASQKKAFDELNLADDHMGMMRQIRFVHPMGPMPPMPPMPVPPGL
jgi:hypothetical protein